MYICIICARENECESIIPEQNQKIRWPIHIYIYMHIHIYTYVYIMCARERVCAPIIPKQDRKVRWPKRFFEADSPVCVDGCVCV